VDIPAVDVRFGNGRGRIPPLVCNLLTAVPQILQVSSEWAEAQFNARFAPGALRNSGWTEAWPAKEKRGNFRDSTLTTLTRPDCHEQFAGVY
jgi:hypothetical protein